MSKKQRYKNPVIYFEDNLIFTKGRKDISNISGKEAWACYRWQGFNFDFLNTDAKIDRLIKNSRAFQQVFSEAQILQIPLKNKIADNMNYLRGIASGEMKPIAMQYINGAEYLLSESDTNENDNETYLIIKLKKPRTLKDYKDLLVSLAQEPYRAVNELLALDIADIYLNEIEAFKRLEQSLRRGMIKYVNIEEINEVDIERLLRSPYWRGLPAPKLRGKDAHYDPVRRNTKKAQSWKPEYQKLVVNGETIIRPLKRDILTLCEGKIDNHLKYIEIEQDINGECKSSYQKHIVVSSLPDMDFPTGREWIYGLKDLGFPVWTSIRFVKREYEEVSKEINNKRKELDDYLEHSREVDAKIGQQYLEQDEAIDQAKYEVEKEKKPFLYTTVIIGVAADTLNECQERAKAVQDYFDEMDIETQIPTGEQFKLFIETMIGSKQYALDYILRLPPETLAGSMIGASNIIGDPFGFPIGTTGMMGKIMKLDPFRASQIDESPSISFTGTLGRGKSLLANLIALLAAFHGARVLINDPKGERGNWGKELPAIKPYLNIIELTPAAINTGKLDIFQVMLRSLGKNITLEQKREVTKQAAEYAQSIIGTLAGYKTTDERMEYLADAISIVSKDENPYMMKIIEVLGTLAEKSEGEKKREVYIRLRDTLVNRINNTAYAHLLFGNGTEDVIDITKPLNIIQTQNLIIPEEGKPEEDFTFQERVGMATLICTSAIGMQFALQSREYLKIYMQDETSVYKKTAAGRTLFNRMVKMGRTENAPIYLLGQNVSDVGESEDVRANIGTRFAFGTKTAAEAKEILKYMGLNEESKELQDMLIDLPTGVCLMRDVKGRVAMIAIDPLFDEFLKAFDTKPKLKLDDDATEKNPQVAQKETEKQEPNKEYKMNEATAHAESVVLEKEEKKVEKPDVDSFLEGWG